jgi:ankyrin repeat protein
VQPESIDFQFLCRNDRRWEAELYICAGADENKSVEQRHSGVARTPLQLAAESGCLNVVYLLLERHAEVEAEDRLGRRPLHLAAQKGHTDVCIALVDSGEADVHAVDHDGNTPLHLAAKANKAQTVHQLASIEEHQIREVLSGRLHPGMDREVPLMFSGAESASV